MNEQTDSPLIELPSPVLPRGKATGVIREDQKVRSVVMRDRPPEILKWIKEVEPCIDSKELGTVPFKPWPTQMAVLHKLVEGGIGIIKKGRQIGMTTTLQVGCAYLLLWRRPAHIHYVTCSEDKMSRMIWETRLALKTADLPEWQRERIHLGTDREYKITYSSPQAESYIRGHAPGNRLRGHPGNVVIMDEVSIMPYAETIRTGFAGMLSDGWTSLWMVSTPNCDGISNNAFQGWFDRADELGIFKLRVDWRANPARLKNPNWLRDQLPLFDGREDQRDQEHCCLDILPVDMAFDPERMEQYAKGVEYLGRQPLVGHNYSMGVDQSGSGRCATVACVIDVSVKPAQVVSILTFTMNATNDDGRVLQKATWIDEHGAEFPGIVLVDSTNEMGTVETVRLRQKIAVLIRGQVQVTENADDGIRKLLWPRSKLMEHAVKLTDTGQLVVHPFKFPELYDALKTAKKWIPGVSKKAQGKNMDVLDAFLLAAIPLTGRGMGVQNGGSGRIVSRPRSEHRGIQPLHPGRQPRWDRKRH